MSKFIYTPLGEAIAELESEFGKGYVKNQPEILAALIQAVAMNRVAYQIQSIQNEMNQFNPQVEAISSALGDIAYRTGGGLDDISEKIDNLSSMYAQVTKFKRLSV